MKKWMVSIICVISFAALAVIGFHYIYAPVKQAVKIEVLQETERPYYLLRWVQTTGAEWEMIGDQNGYYEKPILIAVKSGAPPMISAYNYDVATGGNIYVVYGTTLGVEDNDGVVLPTYEFTDWDILAPITREAPWDFLLPSGYLCKFDLAGNAN